MKCTRCGHYNETEEVWVALEYEGQRFDTPRFGWYCSQCRYANLVDEEGVEVTA